MIHKRRLNLSYSQLLSVKSQFFNQCNFSSLLFVYHFYSLVLPVKYGRVSQAKICLSKIVTYLVTPTLKIL